MFKILLTAGLLTGLCYLFPLKAVADVFSNNKIIEIKNGWEYRWGDSGVDENNIRLWTFQDLYNTEWKSAANIFDPPGRNGYHDLWLRIKLPNVSVSDAVIHTYPIDQYFEVYLDSNLIYQFNESISAGLQIKNLEKYHIISLPDYYQGKYIYFRINSSLKSIGIFNNKIELSSYPMILLHIIKKDIDKIIMSFIYIFVGLIALLFLLFKAEQRLFLSFGFFVICTAIYTFGCVEIKQYIFGNGFQVFRCFEIICFYWLPVGINIFFCQFINISKKNMMYWVNIIQLFFAIVVTFLSFFYPKILGAVFIPFEIMLLINIIILLTDSLIMAYRKNIEFKIFAFGLTIASAFSIYDLMEALIFENMVYTAHIGLFFFIVCLIFILGHKIYSLYKNLEIYTGKEIQKKLGVATQLVFQEYNISNREKEVTILLLKGLRYKEISIELCISIKTVKTHIHNIYKKTSSQNKIQLSNLINKYEF